jgi:hypothetical protein
MFFCIIEHPSYALRNIEIKEKAMKKIKEATQSTMFDIPGFDTSIIAAQPMLPGFSKEENPNENSKPKKKVQPAKK